MNISAKRTYQNIFIYIRLACLRDFHFVLYMQFVLNPKVSAPGNFIEVYGYHCLDFIPECTFTFWLFGLVTFEPQFWTGQEKVIIFFRNRARVSHRGDFSWRFFAPHLV